MPIEILGGTSQVKHSKVSFEINLDTLRSYIWLMIIPFILSRETSVLIPKQLKWHWKIKGRKKRLISLSLAWNISINKWFGILNVSWD